MHRSHHGFKPSDAEVQGSSMECKLWMVGRCRWDSCPMSPSHPDRTAMGKVKCRAADGSECSSIQCPYQHPQRDAAAAAAIAPGAPAHPPAGVI